MYTVKFEYLLPNSEEIYVVAKAVSIDHYGTQGMSFEFFDSNMNELINFPYNKEIFDDLEEHAEQKMFEEKYYPEVSF